MLLKLALRNLVRQPARTGITLLAIAFGVASLILARGFIEDLFIQLGEAIIHSQTGHIQVFKKGFIEKGTRKPEQYLIESRPELEAQLLAQSGVKETTGRLYFSGLLNNGKRDLSIVGEGVEAEKEAKVGTFIRITAGRQLALDDKFGFIAGEGAAHSLGLHPGDRATLLLNTIDGAINTVDLELVGVFQTFSKDYDARAVRIPLAVAQELTGSASVNLLVVTLSDTAVTDAALAGVRKTLEGSEYGAAGWRQLSDFYDKSVSLYDKQFGVLQWIILVMVLLSVINSVNMSAFERQSEFGTLRALGSRPKDILSLLMAESMFLGLLGATLGVILGATLALGLSAIGIPMPPPPNSNMGFTAEIRLVPSAMLIAWCIGFVATLVAAILPARKIIRTPVVDALRQGI